MKKIINGKLMNYISNKTDYNEIHLKEIEYGLTSIYLTISKMIIICSIAYFIGLIKKMFIFMLFFNIIRTTAFGLHATKSWICLLTSTIAFLGIPILCIYLEVNIYLKILIGIIGFILIFKNAPADTKKRPIVNRNRRLFLKICSSFITGLFVISSLIVNNNYISNCLIFSIILENILISPLTYKLFNMSYNNYIEFLKSHPDFNC